MFYLLLAILSISLEIYSLCEIKNIKGLVEEYITYDVSYNLTETNYYNDYLLDESNYKEIIESNNYKIIYFRSDSCEHCLECDEMILAYLASEYYKYCPIYFAKYDMVPELFDEYYSVDSTPTMLLLINKEVDDKAIGFDECFNLLDSIVESMVPKY